MTHPQRVNWAYPCRGFCGPGLGPGGVLLLRGLGAPVEFVIDESEELPGRCRAAKFLDLPQRLA